jgi:NADH-quinone oxidoreductase subunit H
MPTYITSFTDFLKRLLLIVALLVVVLAVLAYPLAQLSVPLIKLLTGIEVDAWSLLTDPNTQLRVTLAVLETPLVKILLFPGVTWASLVATVWILWERKLLAKMQVRVGPQYAGRFEGVLQPFADLFKLLFKEPLAPARADKLIYWAAPLAAFTAGATTVAVIPVSEKWVIASSEVGLLILFAAAGLFPLIVLLASWASNSKYPFLGGVRALHQLVSYEIPLILSTLGVVLLAGSLNLVEIVKAQSSMWFIIPQFLGAAVFFVAALAELERIPFDLPEAEPELVMGWLTEYSSTGFALFQVAAYIKFYALAGAFVSLFLGGWLGPAFLPPEVWFTIKLFIVATLMMIPRGAFPRVRVDLLLKLGWRNLVVLTFINIAVAVLVSQLGVV